MATAVDPAARIERLLAGADARIQRAFLDIVNSIKSDTSLTEIADLIESGRVAEAVERAGADLGGRLSNETSSIFQISSNKSAQFFAGALELNVNFDVTNTRAVRFLRDEKFRLIHAMTDDMRGSVRQALVRGTQAGINPRAQARLFREAIGLTPFQERAVSNYKSLLQSGNLEALERELRDRRFDPTVRRAFADGRGLSNKEINRMTTRYRERYLKYRSEVIARTESLRAVHAGQRELIDQAVEAGKVDPKKVTFEWNTRLDGRERESHNIMNGQTRRLNGSNALPFVSGLGNSLRFPGDPFAPGADTIQCRCVVTTRVSGVSSAGAKAVPPPPKARAKPKPRGKLSPDELARKKIEAAPGFNRALTVEVPGGDNIKNRMALLQDGLEDEILGQSNLVARFNAVTKLTPVSLKDLKTIQNSVSRRKLLGIIDGLDPVGLRDSPIVIDLGDVKVLWDGTHRANARLYQGLTTIDARVLRIDLDGPKPKPRGAGTPNVGAVSETFAGKQNVFRTRFEGEDVIVKTSNNQLGEAIEVGVSEAARLSGVTDLVIEQRFAVATINGKSQRVVMSRRQTGKPLSELPLSTTKPYGASKGGVALKDRTGLASFDMLVNGADRSLSNYIRSGKTVRGLDYELSFQPRHVTMNGNQFLRSAFSSESDKLKGLWIYDPDMILDAKKMRRVISKSDEVAAIARKTVGEDAAKVVLERAEIMRRMLAAGPIRAEDFIAAFESMAGKAPGSKLPVFARKPKPRPAASGQRAALTPSSEGWVREGSSLRDGILQPNMTFIEKSFMPKLAKDAPAPFKKWFKSTQPVAKVSGRGPRRAHYDPQAHRIKIANKKDQDTIATWAHELGHAIDINGRDANSLDNFSARLSKGLLADFEATPRIDEFFDEPNPVKVRKFAVLDDSFNDKTASFDHEKASKEFTSEWPEAAVDELDALKISAKAKLDFAADWEAGNWEQAIKGIEKPATLAKLDLTFGRVAGTKADINRIEMFSAMMRKLSDAIESATFYTRAGHAQELSGHGRKYASKFGILPDRVRISTTIEYFANAYAAHTVEGWPLYSHLLELATPNSTAAFRKIAEEII